MKINENIEKIKLSVGKFVKTYADGDNTGKTDIPIIGEICLIGKTGFYIFTNEIPKYSDGVLSLENFVTSDGEYEYSWFVDFSNENEIEFLDKLPEDESNEENKYFEKISEKIREIVKLILENCEDNK